MLGDEGIAMLSAWLAGSRSLTNLNLIITQMGDQGALALGQALQQNTTMAVLYLQVCH